MSTRRWWLIGGAAGLVAVAAGLWIWQSAGRTPTAEEAALGYLRALEAGDPVAVEATGVDVSTEALEAFAGATDHLEHAEVTSVSADDSGGAGDATATIEVSFRLGGEEHAAELSLVPVDGRWTVDASGLGTVTATTTVGSFVAVGETTVPAGRKTALLPAAYTLSAAPAGLLDGRSPLAILPGEDAEVAVEASILPEATAAAQQQLDEHLTGCTASAAAPPEGCGITIPWGTEFRAASEFRYRVEQLPTIALAGTAFTADGGVLVATVTGTGQDGATRTATYRTESWSVRGAVSFTATDLVLTAW
jgi:hypothetical protein